MKLVLIEFTQDTKDAEGNVRRSAGDRLRVDPESAVSFVDKKKVAKRVAAEKAVAAPAKPEGAA